MKKSLAPVEPIAGTAPAPHPTPKREALPPGPSGRGWGLGLLRAMRADYGGFTSGLRRQYGDITFMRLGAEHAYDLFSPELVRAALVDNASALVRWERGMEIFEQYFGRSVLVTEGEAWHRQRRMLQPAFTPRRVAGYAGLMREAAADALDGAVTEGRTEALVDMDGLFTRVTMDVILRTLFSSRAADDSRDAAKAVQQLSAAAMREMFWPVTLPDWLPLPGKSAKRRGLRLMRELIGRHIRSHRRDSGDRHTVPVNDDLLSRLLALRDETTGAALSDTEVFDQCMVSFQAGHETTAAALLWWSRLMAEHPAVAVRAREEIDSALQGRPPEPDDLAALPWLTATLKEAMRLYPPVGAVMTRRTTRDLTLDGWSIPRGALLRITPWVIQRDPRYFSEPDQFVPERFLPEAMPAPRGAWMPFGAGPRVCIGQHFAMLEITLVAAMLMQRYTLTLPPGEPPCEPVINVTLRPKSPFRLHLTRRQANTSRHELRSASAIGRRPGSTR